MAVASAPIPGRLDHYMTPVMFPAPPLDDAAGRAAAPPAAVSGPAIVDITEGFAAAEDVMFAQPASPTPGQPIAGIVVSGGASLDGVFFDDYLLFVP